MSYNHIELWYIKRIFMYIKVQNSPERWVRRRYLYHFMGIETVIQKGALYFLRQYSNYITQPGFK